MATKSAWSDDLAMEGTRCPERLESVHDKIFTIVMQSPIAAIKGVMQVITKEQAIAGKKKITSGLAKHLFIVLREQRANKQGQIRKQALCQRSSNKIRESHFTSGSGAGRDIPLAGSVEGYAQECSVCSAC